MDPARNPETPPRIPRLVLFDLGNVLISLRPVREVFSLPPRSGPDPDPIDRRIASFLRSEIVERFEEGRASPEEFFAAMRRALGADVPDPPIEERFRSILGAEVPGMRELLRELKRSGVRVAGLSDTNPVHLETLRRYPIVGELETVVASSEIGHRKPSREAYEAALERLEVRAEDVFYTDDLLQNVEGAWRAGIRAVVFGGAAALRRALGLPPASRPAGL